VLPPTALSPQPVMGVVVPAQGPAIAPPLMLPKKPEAGVIPTDGAITFLPGMNLGGIDEEDAVDVDAVLKGLGMETGGSKGGISWSTIKDFMRCSRAAYFKHVLGLKKVGMGSKALKIGTLVHACLEMHYNSGGVDTWKPVDAVAAAGAVELAAESKRYVYAYLKKYAAEEAQTWDIRGVEVTGVYYMDPVKIGGKQVMIPATCKHDLFVRIKEAGAPVAPAGPATDGVYIDDHKTTARMNYDLTKGYSMDGQFLLNALIYRRAEAAQYGPLNGVIVSIIAKHKVMDPDKSLFREHTTVDEGHVDDFYEGSFRPAATELYTRLADAEKRGIEGFGAMNKWEKNYTGCVTRYGLCPYFDICDSHGSESAIIDTMYDSGDGVKLTSEMLTPPTAEKVTRGKTPEELNEKEVTKGDKKAKRAHIKQQLLLSMADVLAGAEGYRCKDFMNRPDATRNSVTKELGLALDGAWPEGTELPLLVDGDPADVKVGPKGIKWEHDGMKASIVWKTLAKDIVARWFDPTLHDVKGGE
jgi:hypothetical protein